MIGDHLDPAIARNDNGEYVVVWVRETLSDWTVLFESAGGDGGSDATAGTGAIGWFAPIYQTDIVARRFDKYGRALDTEFLVNSWVSDSPFEIMQTYFGQGQVEPDDNQLSPDVAIDNDGNFVVVWSGDGELLGDQTGIFGQKFDANGKKIGGNFRINKTVTERQSEPSIGMDPKTGNFVVSWTSRNLNVSGINSGDGSGDGVFQRRFNANCVAQDPADVLVNSWTSGAQKSSDVAMDDQGRYVIVWQSDGQDGSQWGVYGKEYQWVDGSLIQGEFRVNAATQASQYEPQVAALGRNGYVVTWTSFGQDGSDTGIYARSGLFTSTELFTEIQVNQTTARSQYEPHVDGNKDGTYVISWTGYDIGGLESPDDLGVYARMLGTTPSNEFRLNAVQDGDQCSSAVSIDASGNVAAAWEGDNWFETNWVEPNWYNTGTWWFDPTWIEPDYDPLDQFGTVQLPGPDDFTGIYTRVFGQATDELTVQPEPRQSMAIAGTAGDDYFEFIGSTSGSSVVRVTTNGVSTDYPIPNGVTTIRFTGLGGNDRADITGTTDNEVFYLQPSTSGLSTYTGGPIDVEISETETIYTFGGGGNDEAIIGDSGFSDDIGVGPTQVWATRWDRDGNVVYDLWARGVVSQQVKAASGGDTLALYDEAFDSGSFEFEPVLLYEHAHEGPFGVVVRKRYLHRQRERFGVLHDGDESPHGRQ